MSPAFDLVQNPFHLLGLSVRAHREKVVEAYEDALADNRADEAVLMRAQQAVLTPLSRIEAELSWLPGLAPSRAREILSALEENDLGKLDRMLEGLQGLDKANLAAHLCNCSRPETKYVDTLLEACEDFTVGEVQEILKGLHGISGFQTPEQRQVANALDTVRDLHATAAVACITSAESPGEVLTEIVESFLNWDDNNVKRLLDLIVRKYDAWSQPLLGGIEERIEANVATCMDGGDRSPVEQLVSLLVEWDAVNQPVQLLEESKGHEEPRSKKIYGIVHDLCLWLANENGRYEEALTISRALLETFPELPEVADKLSRDVATLETLAHKAKSEALIEPLIAAVKVAQVEWSVLNNDLVASGFGPKSRGIAKKLYNVFNEVTANTARTELSDMPWIVVHGLAIDLSNKHNYLNAACQILEGLISFDGVTPSKAVIEKLMDDRRTLRRNIMWEELRRISGNTRKGLSLVQELLDGAEADERVALLKIKATLRRKKAATVGRRLFWGLATAAFVGFIVYDSNKEPSYSPRPSPTTAYTPSTPQDSGSGSRSSKPPSTQAREEVPPLGTDRVLKKSEVRYCIFQGERLDIIREIISEKLDIDRFNRLVYDFNSRCARFRYRRGTLQAIEAEVPGRRQQLRQDVQRLLSSWPGAPFSSLPLMDDNLIDITTASGATVVQCKIR